MLCRSVMVHLPESFRGGCSFGAGLKAVSPIRCFIRRFDGSILSGICAGRFDGVDNT